MTDRAYLSSAWRLNKNDGTKATAAPSLEAQFHLDHLLMTLSKLYGQSFLNSVCAQHLERTENSLSFLPKGWSDRSRTSYLYAGTDNQTEEPIPPSFLTVLETTNGLRLFGGSVVFYGIVDGRDKFGERDGPVPISIEGKFEIFRNTHPELWNDGFRPVGAIAEERLETLLGSMNSNAVFVLGGDGGTRKLLPMERLLGVTFAVFRRVASGGLDLKELSAATFVDGLDAPSDGRLN